MATSVQSNNLKLAPTPHHRAALTLCPQYELLDGEGRLACLTGPPCSAFDQSWLVSAARIAGVPYTFCSSFSAALALAMALRVWS